MNKPQMDFKPHNREVFYALVGRISLQLIDNNVDAITVANFLREITAAGEHTLTPEQVIEIARNYVNSADGWPTFSRES
jgi:hypothetical protein